MRVRVERSPAAGRSEGSTTGKACGHRSTRRLDAGTRSGRRRERRNENFRTRRTSPETCWLLTSQRGSMPRPARRRLAVVPNLDGKRPRGRRSPGPLPNRAGGGDNNPVYGPMVRLRRATEDTDPTTDLPRNASDAVRVTGEHTRAPTGPGGQAEGRGACAVFCAAQRAGTRRNDCAPPGVTNPVG
jgi:hypothetical protein